MHDLRARLRVAWARIRLAVHTLSHLGPRTTGQVIAHTIRRRRQGESEWAGRTPPGPDIEPGSLADVTALAHGARLSFADASLEVELLAVDVVRLTWGPADPLHPYACDPPGEWAAPEVTVRHAGDGCVVAGGDLELRVSSNAEVRLGRRDGTLLRQDLPPRRRRLAWTHRFVVRPGERLCGLGEQAAGLDLRGGTFRLWNRDPGGAWGPGRTPLYVGVPVLVGVHRDGHLLSFFDNPASAQVRLPGHDGEEDEAQVSFAGGVLRQYVVCGELPTLLERYSALTGRPFLPPRWALGYHQSRWGYRNARHVRAVLDGFRSLGVPVSAVHLDIDYMDGYRVFTVDRRRFPDLGALAERARAQGARLVPIIDPAVKADRRSPLFRQGVDRRLFCTAPSGDLEIGVVWPGKAAFPDFTDPETRAWWAAQYGELVDAGVGGVWHDMNEPTSISLTGDPTLPLATRHRLEGRHGDHADAHNVYGLLMNQAGHTGLHQARPERRPFVLSRSGWAGNQRWAWNWTGDVETSWEGLRQQVATVVGLGLSGIAFSGPDIGGFSGVPDAELYLRWLQLSVLLPFCRTHSVVGAPPREPWRFPEPTRSTVSSWVRLRYRLLPYLYSLAHESSRTGAPAVRPVWWPEGPTGRGSQGEDDTFRLGDAVVVAPATAPGQSRRTVELPPGEWHLWWGAAERRVFTATTEAPCPLERIPVFVRAGSILALDDGWAEPGGPCALHDDQGGGASAVRSGALSFDHEPGLLTFHCWPLRGRAEGSCVDDAGDGDGPARDDALELSDAEPGDDARLRWRRHGAFAPPQRVRVVLHGLHIGSATADGVAVPTRGAVVECGPFDELRLEDLRPA